MKNKLRILATNDEGINADGIAVLCEAARTLAPDVELWVIAPDAQRSGVSQSITMHRLLYVIDGESAPDEHHYATTGTPADCVTAAIDILMKESPDFVLSGINRGINIGNDVNFSGTLGAAFMALTYGIPSIALSMEADPSGDVRWDTAREIISELLKDLISQGWEKGYCLSINIPNLSADKITGVCWTEPAYDEDRPMRITPKTDEGGEKAYDLHPAHYHMSRDYGANTDAAALRRGEVSISVLSYKRVMPLKTPSYPLKLRPGAQSNPT